MRLRVCILVIENISGVFVGNKLYICFFLPLHVLCIIEIDPHSMESFGPKHLFCISLRLKFELHVKFIWCTFYYAMTDNLFIFCIIIYLFVSWKNMFHSAYSVQKKTAVIAIIPQQLQIEISHLNGEWKCFHCIVKQQA